ncbi:MAG TPA: hypothetical protein VFT59_03260, partial [Candidatus Saccharimonadales bacterium]|nr:hypothetical protein [Candidatus Saccharimonadales bacterium]
MSSFDFTTFNVTEAVASRRENLLETTKTQTGDLFMLLQDELQELTGGNVRKSAKLTAALIDLIDKQGLAAVVKLIQNGPEANQAPANDSVPALPSSKDTTPDTPVNTEPSEAEKLGNRLLGIFGGDPVRTNQAVQFMERAMSHDMRLLAYMNGVYNALTRKSYPDQLVDTTEGPMLKSDLDLRTAKDEADKASQALDVLLRELFGATVVVGSVQDNLRDARKEILDLKKGASLDTHFQAAEIASGIKREKDEEFAAYLTRVISEYRKVNTDLYKQIETQSGVAPKDKESVADYIGRVQVKLLQDANVAYSTLLDEVGNVASVKR